MIGLDSNFVKLTLVSSNIFRAESNEPGLSSAINIADLLFLDTSRLGS